MVFLFKTFTFFFQSSKLSLIMHSTDRTSAWIFESSKVHLMEMPRKWSFSFFFLNFNLNLNFLFLWATITSEQYLRHFLAQTEIRIKNFYVEIAQVRSAIFFFSPYGWANKQTTRKTVCDEDESTDLWPTRTQGSNWQR